ncbi:MAG: ABC transporter permease [Methylacidiphilales bacterium]|nr:ABC transporter permease [Candidatus Methylacidiphilales bacterium]NJR17703.1 ABC transporter permease [Calothrix sp. CSU_2_0]
MSRSKALTYYVTVRLLLAPLQILTIVTMVFALLRVAAGDPVDAILGVRAPDAAKEALRKQLGLDLPLPLQYLNYLGSLFFKFDMGKSITSRGKGVWEIISEHFPATAELAIFSIIVALVVGITVGTISASRPGTKLDVAGRLFGIITYALPMFWAGMILQLIFSVGLDILPLGTRFPAILEAPEKITGLYTIDSLLRGKFVEFFTAIKYLILPSCTLGILLSGIFERIVRVNLKQTLQSDYVEAARARGIPENKILISHALKNALIPVITVLGLTFASLLGGAILTEVTFSWPGLASRLYEAITERDYPTVQGIMVFFGAIVVMASILIDILNASVDPRIRY